MLRRKNRTGRTKLRQARDIFGHFGRILGNLFICIVGNRGVENEELRVGSCRVGMSSGYMYLYSAS